MRTGTLIRLETTEERPRRVYTLRFGGNNDPRYRYRWDCPVGCGFRVDEDNEPDAQMGANDHACDACWTVLRWPS